MKKIVKEDMICPVTLIYCKDECCTVGSECNLSGNSLSNSAEPKQELTPDENWLVTIPAAVDEQPSSEDKEINELSRRFLSMEGQLLEKDFEIERLKGLIETLFKKYRETNNYRWQQFKTENNL